ncbi:GNAT family N-acetyltransferase [Streptomyces formicae]|uniref:Lysine N-acyltransferase MbtK n=1 Tax=Streptomyces formicae TaxID=1616117 RepID=A0ABY3WLM4_9ACTN|nr:GNAT family N-acetyltransferase [Streptomyces formicae]UNM11682.1 acetyltransferase [Streptomyces formicae]
MPPTESSTDSGTDTGASPGTPTDGGAEDTLDLRLPDELIALFGEDADQADGSGAITGAGLFAAALGGAAAAVSVDREDLLDAPADWGAATTPIGSFQLVPVRIERDLQLISRWMNDPAVAAFWQLSGPESVAEAHLRAQLDGDGRSAPCLGVLDGVPMSYFEVYRADLDPLARHYPARPHDTGIHLLIGGVADRGRGVGTALLRAVADLVLDHRPRCARVVAEPDLRNTPSVSAFLSAGFRFSAEVDLPDKRAALMVRDRALSNLL